MKHIKHLLALVLGLVLVLLVLPGVEAKADTYGTWGDFTYRISYGEVSITDCSGYVKGTITIPASIAGYPVTSIGDNAFEGSYGFEKVILPDSMQEIGRKAFIDCSMKSIKLGNGLRFIRDYAFANCDQLSDIIIPASVTYIGDNAFARMDGLDTITFLGDAPTMVPWGDWGSEGTFRKSDFVLCYPDNNSSWDSVRHKDFNGDVRWMSYTKGDSTIITANETQKYFKNGVVESYTGLFKYQNQFWDIKQGDVTNYTGLRKHSGSWWYVKDGKVATTFTGLVEWNGETWYIVKGKVASNVSGLTKINGGWWYLNKGKVAAKTTGLVKYNGEWWYVVKGKVASGTTTLIKHSGSWWHVKNGKVAAKTTGLVKYDNEWWYVVKGKVATNTTGLIKHAGEWWYVVKGKVASNTTTLLKHSGKWWYIQNGKVSLKTATLVPFNGTLWYVKDGHPSTNSPTLVKYDGNWYHVKNGKVATTVTVLISYGGEQWYVVKGKVASDIDQLVKINGSLYYIKKGKFAKNSTTLVSYQGSQWYVKNGKPSNNAPLVFENCYMQNGKVDYNYDGLCPYNGRTYYILDGRVQTYVNGMVTFNNFTFFVKSGIMTNCHIVGHNYEAATCSKPMRCKECTYIGGAQLTHNYSSGKCVNCGHKESSGSSSGSSTIFCLICGGREKNRCSYCGGTGGRYADCRYCYDGWIKCSCVKNSGGGSSSGGGFGSSSSNRTCAVCRGSGRVDCLQCSGGVMSSGRPCSNPSCSGGTKPCTAC